MDLRSSASVPPRRCLNATLPSQLTDPGTETIAHERVPETIAERRAIAPYINSRITATMFKRRQVEGEVAQEFGSRIPWDLPDQEITAAAHNVFNYLTAYAEGKNYEPLLVSPLTLALTTSYP